MATNRRYPQNRQLAWERLQRGWSYEELARQVIKEMDQCGEPNTGLTANTVRRWETGERWPDPRYRRHLVAVFRKPASELGLLTPEELALRPIDDFVKEIRRLLGMVADQTDGHGIDRITFLRGVLGTGALPLLSPFAGICDPDAWARLASAFEGNGPMDDESVAAYAAVASHQRILYWTAPAEELFETAYAHTHLGVRLMRGASSGQARDRLAGAVAQAALLAGRLAFFDLHQPAAAQRLYDVALAATEQAGDHQLAAATLAHAALIPGFARDHSAAAGFMDAALAHARHGVESRTRAWLHCIGSEIEARCGDPMAGQRHIGHAEAALDGNGEDPEWFDFFSPARLDAFAGYCNLAAGDQAEAVRRLESALDGLDGDAVKQRSVLFADLATAHAASNPDASPQLLRKAIDAIERDWYATGHSRVREALRALPDTPARGEIEEQLRELSIAHTGSPGLAS